MEPLLPSEVARLVYGYLRKEQNEETAECFLKSSPHLSECYQMFKSNRNFNTKFNGFNLHDIFDIFGTMCGMINDRVSEECESKTVIERLQYLLDLNHVPTKKDKCVATESDMIDKYVGDVISTQDKSTHTLLNIEANKSTSEVLEIPSFTEIISSNISKTKEVGNINETSITVEKNSVTNSSPCLLSTTQLLNNIESTPSFSKVEDKDSPNFKINKQICSTPAKNTIEPILHLSQKNIRKQLSPDELECQKIPEATSLESMPGLSKDDQSKDGSVVIDTGELVDTFLNDQSLLEKLADTINKSLEAQRETDDLQESKILDPPTLEKALDSTQSDPQIKNILDEFLVFNVDNSDDGKKTCAEDQNSSIKSRLRSAKKNDAASNKLKKGTNILKNVAIKEDNKKIDNNIILFIQEGNTDTIIENYDLLSNQVILQSNGPKVTENFGAIGLEESYLSKYVKIAPKVTPASMVPLAHEKCIFPKRRKRSLEGFGIKSKFRKTNTKSMSSTVLAQTTPQSIIIEVPNQNSFEIQAKNNIDNNITQLPVVSKISSEVKDIHDTPDDRLKPPKNKSMSTPRKRSTHIRCLDFSTPQPKNIRDQARSKLFCDTPKRFEKVVEEPESSPLPKLQADWGSVNGFESMVNKETSRHWDTDIREMVGAGILTSDADGRKTRKKKTPRKKIKSINDKNNSEVVIKGDELNNLMQTNESQSNIEINKSNTFKNICAVNEQNDDKSLKEQSKFPISLETSDKVPDSYFKEPLDKSLNDQSLKDSLKTQNKFIVSLETSDKIELCNEQPIKSNSVTNFIDKKHGEFPIALEAPDKITELCNEKPIKSKSLTNFIDKNHGEFPIALETPDKISELCNEQPIKSNSLTNFIDKNHGDFPIALETPDKITELCNKQSIESNSLKDVNDKKHSEFPMSLETPDKITEICIKQLIKSDTSKNLNDKKLLQKHSEFPILLVNTDKISESCSKQTTIESNSVKISCQTLNKLSDTDINEQENNLNQLNTLTTTSTAIKSTITSNSKSVLEITKKSKEKDSNFLETFNNHNYLKPLLIKQPENNLNKPTENVKPQILLNQIETNRLDELNSPIKCGIDKIQPIKHLVETPFKCDDVAVDVPETPISKLIREYDPSKLITPLHCTPEHDEDSLTETPLTKIFRETSYLNRPPISPFPPTPGNSMSVDTLLVQSDQECSKISNSICSNVNGLKEFLTQTISKDKESPIQAKKVKSLQSKTKPKPSIKSKMKYESKEKSVEAKKKQVYESVKVELFGSEISSSSSADELEKTNRQPKPIVINIKQDEDKKSGFKRIPKKKLIQSSPVLVNGIENSPLNEFNTKISKSVSVKSTIIPRKEDFLQETKNTSNIKKSKKNMVHFDDPVEEIINMSTNSTLNQSKRVNTNKIKIKTVINENPEQLIGLSRYLNKSVESNKSNYINKKKSKTIESEIKTSKLNNSNNINNSGTSKGDRSGEKISEIKQCSLNDEAKTYGMSNLQNKSSEKYLIDENKKSNNRKEKSTVLKKSIEPLNIVKPTFTDAKTSNHNSISTKLTNNTNLDKTSQSNSTISNNNNGMNNTSCVTVGYNDESNFQLRKFDVPLNNMEYLKIPKVYEIISEDGIHEMVHLHLSEAFTFLDIPSELNSIHLSTPIVSPLITNSKILDVTPEIVVNELMNDVDVLIPATSTPKDTDERQIKEKQNRDRRSPSLWDDSDYNYPTNKYRDDRHRESNRWKNTGYRDNRYDKKYWSKSRYDDEWLQHDRRNHFYWNYHVKREFRDDPVRDKDRSKYKEDKRRYRDYNNYDDRKGRDLEESKRFLNPQRMLKNDIVKKTTKRPADRTDHNKTPAKVSKVEHQRLLKNVNVDDFLSVVHGQK